MNKYSQLAILILGIGLIFLLLNFDLNPGQYLTLVVMLASIPLLIKKPEWGLFVFLAFRNVIDIFGTQALLNIGQISLNLASLIGIAILPWAVIVILKKLRKNNAKGISELLNIPLVKLWLSFVLIAVISTIFFSQHLPDSLEVIVKFINYFLLYILGFLFSKEIGIEKFFQWIFLILFIPSIAALVQIFIGSGFSVTGVENRLLGTFAHPNAFAFAMVIGFAAVITLWSMAKLKRDKLLWSALGFYYFVLLILTYTRSAWIASFLIVVIWLINYQRKLIIPFVMVLVLAILLFPSFSNLLKTSYNINLNDNPLVQRLQPETEEEAGSISWRWRTWEETLPAVWKQPFLGYGPGTFPYVRKNYVGYESDLKSLEAHNDYLRLAIETGLVGLGTYLMLYLALLKRIIKQKNKANRLVAIGAIALVVSILITSFTDNVLRNAPVQWMLWTTMGVVMGYLMNTNELPKRNIK